MATRAAWIRAQGRARQGPGAEAAAAGAICSIRSGKARGTSAASGPTSCSAWAATSPFPGGMMASLLGRPLALHEQNAIAGLTNRVLARRGATRCMAGFPQGAARSAEWTGNPVRAEIAAIAPPRSASRPQRAAAAPGRRRQPRRAGAERGAAARARAARAEPPAGRAPVGREASRGAARALRRGRRAGRARRVHRRHGARATPRPTSSSAAPAR